MRFNFWSKKKIPSPASAQTAPAAPQIRIVFMGTPPLAHDILEALVLAGYQIVGVVTQPDKPVGRKHELTPPPVKVLAVEKKIPVFQPEKLTDENIRAIAAWRPDLILVAAYGKILPEALLKVPGLGSLNVHASLLPRWRGASPIQNALLSGDKTTGVTLMLMDKGMDTGEIVAQKEIEIFPDETAGALTERLAKEGGSFLLEILPRFIRREITPIPQPLEGVTLCQLIDREDGRVFWNTSAEDIYNRFRGLTPWPGLFTFWKKGDDLLRLKLLEVSLQKTNPVTPAPEGTVVEVGEKVGVRAGEGVIFLETLQLEGKEPVAIRDFLNGNPEFVGSLLV